MSMYMGPWTPFSANVIGAFANGCEYSGPSISSFGPSDPVTQCGPRCQETVRCAYFTFVGNATDDTSVGVCTLFGNNTSSGDSTTVIIPSTNLVTGPWVANGSDVCGFFGRDENPRIVATTISSTETTTAQLVVSTGSSTSTSPIAATTDSNGSNFNVPAIIGSTVTVALLVVAIITWLCMRRAKQKRTVDLPPKITPTTPNNYHSDIYTNENTAASTAAAARKKMEWEEAKQRIPIGLNTIEMPEVKGNAFVKMPHSRPSGK
ncbi:hypothetical protein HK100_004647 [Physocladia obscura]|uniref:Apple domain-containing protein n=1 Tax=Physocladia obscura TaxID=109957 RepID=A0AAD5XJG9_9FUNG|nr:hypothetical protein HK100_004647 [Physocladia obscura]